MRAVFDTNAWLDVFVFDDGAARPLRTALLEGALHAVRSARTDAELPKVLERPHFARRCNAGAAQALVARWQALAQDVQIVQRAPWACRDPDDQKFLDLACSAHAALLLTKDRALLALAGKAGRAGLRICTPGDYALVDGAS
jgi:putative PIN family toxin of toxin-antitoxin system